MKKVIDCASMHLPLIAAVLLLLTLCLASASFAADVGNCLLCHKFPGLSRVDSEGKLRLFFVNEGIFNNSVHSKVKCEGCHTDITEIPHKEAKKVDCLTECHITEPSSETKFSHKSVAEHLSQSIHGTNDNNGKMKRYAEDMPTCKDCHDEPLYRPLSFFKQVRFGVSEASLGRCRVCHKKDDFIYKFYNHVTSRLHKSRNAINIAEVCARCHNNTEIVARHKLSTKAVYSYGETFHGKAARYFDDRVPDCLDCHVNKGESVHQLLSHNNPIAPTNDVNRNKICASMECHPAATPKLATYKVHAEFNLDQSPGQYYFTLFFIVLTGGTLLPLMGIIFLDLVRKLFPNAAFKRRRK